MRSVGAFNTTGNSNGPYLSAGIISQSFVSPSDYLYEVEIITTGARPQHDVPLSMKLIDEKDGVVATSSATLRTGQQDAFVTFAFSPLTNSAHRRYQMQVTVDVSAPEALGPLASSAEASLANYPDLNDIHYKIGQENYYQQGELFINGQEQGREDLVFRTFHSSPQGPVPTFLAIAKKHWQADAVFLSLFFLLFASLLTGCLYELKKLVVRIKR